MTPTRLDVRRRRAEEDGFTLVELLVAISLLAVVLVALTATFIAAVRSVGDQRLRASATRVATDHLERLRALPSDQLDAQAGQTTTTTPDGREFRVDTEVTSIDSATGQPAIGGAVKQVTVTVGWTSRGRSHDVSYTTAVAPDEVAGDPPGPAIGPVAMFPNPVAATLLGQPLQDIEVTVSLTGFPASTLVQLAWTNADGAAASKTLTSTTGVNWSGTIARDQILGLMVADRGEVTFQVSAEHLGALYTLALRVAPSDAPAITDATIDRNPITVASPSGGRTCADRNQCQNTTDVTFVVVVDRLDPAQDSVILQYQLHDGSFQEVPLAPAAGQWQLTVRRNTTKFLVGTARSFRFTAIRSSDGATTAAAVVRDVVRT